MDRSEVIEVHNVWAIYGLSEDGTELEKKFAQFARPQDWGDPRWHYERFRFDWLTDKHYINHVHCWTDLKLPRWEYPQLFAPFIIRILMPGKQEQFCGRDYLDEEDFWEDEWGPKPPAIEFDEDDEY